MAAGPLSAPHTHGLNTTVKTFTMQTDLFDNNASGAEFSSCRKYRYKLWRRWDESKGMVMFIGLNPSTANETEVDATIRRVIGFAKRWGYGGVYMLNCFPLVSTDPAGLELPGKMPDEPSRLSFPLRELEANDFAMVEAGKSCELIVCAWGSFDVVKRLGRDKAIFELFKDRNTFALQVNKNGSPKHPLYCASDLVLTLYSHKGVPGGFDLSGK